MHNAEFGIELNKSEALWVQNVHLITLFGRVDIDYFIFLPFLLLLKFLRVEPDKVK